MRQPCFVIPHGVGPCFFMDNSAGIWTGVAAFLCGLPERPRAVPLVSGHWETEGFAFTGRERPSLLYGYYNFSTILMSCAMTRRAPALAARAAGLLGDAGFVATVDPERGLDHGVFIPLKIALPDAAIPVVEMSVDRALDPAQHVAANQALAALRDEGVLILGSGMSFRNMRGYGDPRFTAPSEAFDSWLDAAVSRPGPERAAALSNWEGAPAARIAHPKAEHLLPRRVSDRRPDRPS